MLNFIEMNEKIVVKFGGSNLKEIESIERLIELIKLYQQPPIIVVSAFYGITDQLIEVLANAIDKHEKVISSVEKIKAKKFTYLEHYIDDVYALNQAKSSIEKLIKELEKYLFGINYIGEIPPNLNDKILSYGERLSALCINLILNQRQLTSAVVLPEEFGLLTTGESGNSSVDFDKCNPNITDHFNKDIIYIVPGFYGISAENKITLLGRGGTDYSAASLARLLNAKSLDIWKDVNGFMTADPRFVESPIKIDHLSYLEAAELAYFGAKILHPRTVEPLIDINIPINLFNIQALENGLNAVTLINGSTSKSNDIIKSVTSSDDVSVLKLNGPSVGIKPGVLAKITSELNNKGINIKSVITSQIAINLILSAEDILKAKGIVQALNLDSIQEVIGLEKVSVIAIVGEGILEKPGIGAKIFSAMEEHKINVMMSALGGSNVVCYIIISEEHKQKAITAIHHKFFN